MAEHRRKTTAAAKPQPKTTNVKEAHGRAPARNAEIADAFDEIADLLELEQENPFRIRAYRNAARLLRGLGTEISQMLARGEDLSELPGIGKDLAGKIAEVVATGTTPVLAKLRNEVPPSLTELLHLPSLGPKRVKLLYDELGIHTLAQLHRAIKDGRLRALPGFGQKTVQHVLAAIEAKSATPARFKLALVASYADDLVAYMMKLPGVDRAVVAGSFRRGRETVGDLDLLVTTKRDKPAMDGFVNHPEVANVAARGSTRGTVVLRNSLQVDLRIVQPESYGAALHYFTGSKAHNIAIRTRGMARGLKINEYGVFRGGRRIAGETEEQVYRAVGLPYIEPELRENRGEIEAALKGALPRLVELRDLKGDLHAHTTATDGHNTLEEMAAAAAAAGLDYIAITEHSKRLSMAHGLDERRLLAQIDAIDRYNRSNPPVRVLKGIEVDILEDGSLDLPDSVLRRLDLVIGAVHSRFELSRDRQTERVLKAMDQPHFSILAHPSGRLIPDREPFDLDIPRIIAKAKARGCFLELNAHPDRLDLFDTHCRMAKDAGVLVSINSDAHRATEFANLRFGLLQARRGWLEKPDVLNTRSLDRLFALLRPTMQRR